ncbi:MAG TPA: hypothetical protein VF381_12920 [Thermoanaerobaculia bacterium]
MFNHYYGVAVAGSLLTGIGQVMLKSGARGRGIRLWFNGRVIAAYVLFVIVTLMSLYAYKFVPIRAAVFLSPLALLTVTLISVGALGERLSRVQIAGCMLLLAGIAVFNL